MKALRFAILIMFALFAGLSTAQWALAEDSDPAFTPIPDEQLNAYTEVSRIRSENPGLTAEEVQTLLQEHGLSREEYDRIDLQIQAGKNLNSQGEASPGEAAETQEPQEELLDVRTKLKDPLPDGAKE